MQMNELQCWSDEEFEARLRAMGDRYHIHHPFQVMMHRGQLSREQIQGWVANRYYYQINIPIKDAAILANCPDRLQSGIGEARLRFRRKESPRHAQLPVRSVNEPDHVIEQVSRTCVR